MRSGWRKDWSGRVTPAEACFCEICEHAVHMYGPTRRQDWIRCGKRHKNYFHRPIDKKDGGGGWRRLACRDYKEI